MAKKKIPSWYATGRRKTATARVFMKAGTGRVTVNKADLDDYFCRETDKMIIRQPLVLTEMLDSFDFNVTVRGGGTSGQAGAIKHGISRALLKNNPELRGALKGAGFLTRDARIKERKKYGLKGARARYQFSKR
ncbi:MAG TPA: 30S ribosomal protein S9 [Deltaproteobacteria bacterium]|nr:30S ribosomal protein S9 [Deltaproteobacteria bacterium]HCP46111.1 30S ribosomal protein S9 [Deltaproteobacteria bacterium]|tara:strand:- start:215 stop:616 length:402 start_codon:yes stop_codon:yes gene_type:complete